MENYYEKFTKRCTPTLTAKIKNRLIGIAGVGGLGSNIAVSLVRSGVTKLIIADFDIVEESNLNRQYYFKKHIGMRKVDALEDVLKSINPDLEIIKHSIYLDSSNFDLIFSECEILAEAFDKAENKAMIAGWFLEKKRDMTLISGNGMGGYFSSNIIQTKKIRDNFYMCGDFEHEATEENGVLSPRVLITANHQANMIIRILMGEKNV
ncbi:sulfur carrier protein ThiS adenylyltransferase ThiF [bacterium]|nr:sulfur carrier protein ThiS adenylyltransferase ThiF [bacterium]